MGKPANVVMDKDGVQTEVANNESVKIMEGLGWKVVETYQKKPAKDPKDEAKKD